MLQTDVIVYVLWLSLPALQGFLIIAMWVHNVRRRLPVFFAWVVFSFARTIPLLAFHFLSAPWAYFGFYWLTQSILLVLSIAVVYELYTEVFRDYPAIIGASHVLFRWAAVVLIFVAAVAVASTSGAESDRLMAGLMSLDQAAGIVRGGLLALLFLLGGLLGLRWKHYVFGVVTGLALYTTVEVTATAINLQFGSIVDRAFNIVNSASYICAILIWVKYLVSRESQLDSPYQLPAQKLDEWNAALTELIRK